MDNPNGIVRSLVGHATGTRAIVEIDVAAACPRCAAGKGCGAGFLSGTGGTRQVEALVGSGLDIITGDKVEVTLRPRDLLHAALVVYGVPMLGAIVAAGVAYVVSAGDIEAAVAALSGLAVGVLGSRLYLARPACLSRFVPTVEKRLPAVKVQA